MDQEPSNICQHIKQGNLNHVIDVLKRTDFTQDIKDDEAVYALIKIYIKFLSKHAIGNDISLECAWKCDNTEVVSLQKNVRKILRELFKCGLSPNNVYEDETPLMCAIKSHDEEVVKVLMENGADPSLLTPSSCMNALSLAIIFNETSILKLILSYSRADVNSPCCHSLTPLQLAINKSTEMSKILIQNGANIDQVVQVSGSQTVSVTKPPLIYAVETENHYLVSVLLENGEDINQCYGECSNSPIHLAVMQESVDMVKLLIQYGANVNKRNSRGHTVLGLALHQQKNGKALAETLIAAGCSWKKCSMLDIFLRHFPPAHILAYLGYDFHLDILKFLVEKAKLSHQQENIIKSMTRSYVVHEGKDPQLFPSRNLLRSSERDLDLPEKENQEFVNMLALDKSTALFMAVWGGNLKIAEFLYEIGADPFLTCSYGNLVHAAVMSRKTSVEMLNFALQFNFNVNIQNEDGNTPLNLAARNSSDRFCSILMDHGALLNVRDRRFGETPLSISIYFGFENNAEMLICGGADPDIPDFRDTTALYWAVFNCREKSLCLLLQAGVRVTRAELAKFPKNIKVMREKKHLRDMLFDYVAQPRSLQQCSRLAIRKQLNKVHSGTSIMPSVMSLPLPARLKNVIALKTFML